MKVSTQLFNKFTACAILLCALSSCSGGGSGGGSTTAPLAPATGSATVTGTVSGTVIKVLRADTKALISQFDTAPLPGPPPFPFALSNIPVGLPIEILFFSAGQTFPLYGGNPPTNVFAMQTAGSIDLGAVTMSSGRATSQNPFINVILGVEDLLLSLLGNAPPPATLTLTPPAPATGAVIVDFAVQNFVIGGQGQQHLHIRVDGGTTRHFFDGQTNKVLDDNGQATIDVVRQSATSFRINGLPEGLHTVTARLSTASEVEFVNPEANPLAVPITINSPNPVTPTLTITSPLQGDSFPSGDVDVSFIVQNFTIGSLSAAHLHIVLDGGPTYHFYNGTNNVVLDDNNAPVTNITWQSISSFRITGLSGPHTIRLALTNSAHVELQNAEANPPILNFTTPPAPPTLTINSPAQGATLPPGPVPVSFTIQNSPITTSTQPRMHFYVDGNNSVLYKFHDGSGITEDGSTSGVRYQGVHTHFVHWKSGGSIQINALASGSHEVRFVLVDQSETELPGTEKTLAFSIAAETGGAFSLEEVASGLNFPTAMATAPDGRIFVTELVTGNIRVVTPNPLPQQWTVQTAPFATLPVVTGNEKGLLGIAVHPNFSQNGFVYVFYTATGPVNRVVRFTATTSGGDTVATNATPEIIFDNIPAANDHNGGFIQFGPDGMLYIFVGENDVRDDAQSLSTLRGKILRINPDGGIPSDNPFFNTLLAPFSAIYSYGHRNSFGFTFHPHTDHLWQTENGDRDNDQINRIIAGGNYGWPICQGICTNPLYIDPIITFGLTRIAPTGIVAIREDSAYPAQYHNNLLFANFNFGQLRRIVLGGDGLTDLSGHTIACNCGQGGLLAVMHGLNVQGQDGYIYVANGAYTTSNHRIFRVVLNP